MARGVSALIRQEDAGRAEDRVGHALEGADHHDRAQAGGALALDDGDRLGDVLRPAQDGAAELVDDDLRTRRPWARGRSYAGRPADEVGDVATRQRAAARTISGTSSSERITRTSVGDGSSEGVILMPSAPIEPHGVDAG